MNRHLITILAAVFCLIALTLSVFAQNPTKTDEKTDDWYRVQSDDGEFSIEVPVRSKFFADTTGFSIGSSNGSDQFEMTKMAMANAVVNGTLVSFERYEAKRGALAAQLDMDVNRQGNVVRSSIKRDGYNIEQVEIKDADKFLRRYYFYSKKNVYILTTGSRGGETPEMRRFLDSLKFTPDVRHDAGKDVRAFSRIKTSDITIVIPPYSGRKTLPAEPVVPTADDKGARSKVLLLIKPRAPYTIGARMNGTQGSISIRATFDIDGFISRIEVLTQLPNGLVRQALIAALRIKFLPAEFNVKPEASVRTIQYNFSLY